MINDQPLELEFAEYALMVRIVDSMPPEMLEEFQNKLAKLAETGESTTRTVKGLPATLKDLFDVYTDAKYQELLKTITGLERELAESSRMITTLMRETDSVDLANLRLERENRRLQARVEELEASSMSKSKWVRSGGMWYDTEVDPDLKQPFCVACEPQDGSRIPLTPGSDPAFVKWHCPKCYANYN